MAGLIVKNQMTGEEAARGGIRWEAEQHVPFDMANVELDFQILDPNDDGLQMNVLLVAAKRELVEGRVGLLKEAGLQAAVIDVDAFAIHNAFELNHPDAMQGVVGLVNIGHEVTNVNVLEDGVPVLTRDLSVGTRRFREDLQREKGLSAEQSEEVVQGRGTSADLAGYVEARGGDRGRVWRRRHPGDGVALVGGLARCSRVVAGPAFRGLMKHGVAEGAVEGQPVQRLRWRRWCSSVRDECAASDAVDRYRLGAWHIESTSSRQKGRRRCRVKLRPPMPEYEASVPTPGSGGERVLGVFTRGAARC